jgi:hypothetical protein
MKKPIIVLSTLILSLAAFSQTYNGIGFPGTFGEYLANGVIKNTATTPFQEQQLDAYARFVNIPNQVLFGHSQGGVRALAHAALCEMRAEESQTITVANANKAKSNVRAVIDIAGPINGHTGLQGGVDACGSRIRLLGQEIINGYVASHPPFNFLPALPVALSNMLLSTPIVPASSISNILTGLGINFEGTLDQFFSQPVPMETLVRSFYQGRLGGNGIITNISDFVPNSTFYNTYFTQRQRAAYAGTVTTSTTTYSTVLQTPGHWATVCTGYIWVAKSEPYIGLFGWTYYRIVWVQQPVYLTYWVFPVYASVPNTVTTTSNVYQTVTIKPIPDDTYIAVFAGTDKDPLNMMESQQAANLRAQIAQYEKSTYEWTIVHTAFSAFFTAVTVAAAVTLDVPAAIVFAALATNSWTYAFQASAGNGIAKDYVKAYNERILCSSTNSDGFIPEEASYYTTAKFGGTALMISGEIYARRFFNHTGVMGSGDIWGTGGMDTPPKKGQVRDALLGRGLEGSLETGNYDCWDSTPSN